jgi:MYXO-CTERM domain-containing protein
VRFDPRFYLAGGVAVLVVGLMPAVSEASFAKSIGSRYGGTLSTNTSLSTQQLTADPASIQKGSMSTEYDPSIVSLESLIPSPTFGVSALIGVRLPGDPTERFVTDTAFFAGLPTGVTESGYLQVSFERLPEHPEQGSVPTLPGYVVVAADGETDGDETHALLFSSRTENSSAIASYHIYQEDGTHHAVLPDYLIDLTGQTADGPIGDATVSGVVPEPTVGAVAMALAGVFGLRRRRH